MNKICKIVLGLWLSIYSLTVSAEWESVSFTDTDINHYIDTKRIDRNRKPFPGLWVLMDYSRATNTQKFKSVVLYMEFNCIAKKNRISIAYTYEKAMGKGAIVDTLENGGGDFKMSPPDSPPEFYMQLVCSK